MRKLYVLAVVVILVLTLSVNLTAGKKDFFLNIGAITDDSLSFDPFLWYAGFNIDFHIGGYFMLSPEVDVVTYKFKFDTFLLQPALLLNIKMRSFFIGGGINKYFLVSGDSYEASDLGLKLNAGIIRKKIKFRIFADMAFDNLFKDMLIGFQIGIAF